MAKKFVPFSLLLFCSLAHSEFPDSHDPVPREWTGDVFRLSQAYPASIPKADAQPWLVFDPRTQPSDYVNALYQYALEGNVTSDWNGASNTVRPWFHVPWMHFGPKGREFVRGLTRERTTPKALEGKDGELGAKQKSCAQNWAVSLYNAHGGYQIGQIWKNPDNPNSLLAVFPEGTVVVKLLFTAATEAEVPYLKETLEWTANINDIPAADVDCRSDVTRSPQKVRLLQMDLAVKDKRAPVTGWVFATMSYDGNSPGANWYERMIPVGSQWGNDPNLPSGTTPSESWINPANQTPQHLGYQGRLNGPVDNPRSACMSCHTTAQVPARSGMTPPPNPTSADIAKWFRNLPGDVAFDNRAISTDYSLQVAAGIQSFQLWKSQQGGAFAPPIAVSEISAPEITKKTRLFELKSTSPSNKLLRIENEVVHEIER
ncbi:hypothetical protein [Pseudomonas thivervalensis]|uniref:hypothetical protein n=1 Tax=Pseudomonas thivervalensis TaxID=86265 RepID=UPI003D64A1C9